jgi:hypothetical protein
MLRYLLLLILIVFVARAFWRLVDGIMEGARGVSPKSSTPQRSVQMVRDPVCGTFVVPGRALTISDGSRQLHFCSEACRDKYRARTA